MYVLLRLALDLLSEPSVFRLRLVRDGTLDSMLVGKKVDVPLQLQFRQSAKSRLVGLWLVYDSA